jgi:hypothetical protein
MLGRRDLGCAANCAADKKLLITCLQFLNNLIARNEQRKLMLWIELFDSHLDSELPNFADMKSRMDFLYRLERNPERPDESAPAVPQHVSRGPDAFKIPQQPASSPFLLYIGEIGAEVKKSLIKMGEKAGANEIASECKRQWQTMNEEEKNVSHTSMNTKVRLTLLEMEHALRRRRRTLPRRDHPVQRVQASAGAAG